MKRHRIAVIPGDGIGPEVVDVGVRVLDEVARADGDFAFDFEELPWGSAYFRETGRMMPDDALTVLRQFDAIYLGAVGSPDVPDHLTLWGLLLPIRQRFNQYVNLRPVKLFPGVVTPLRDKGPEDIDMVCVRENSEGEYAGVGGRVHVGFEHELALQTDVFTRKGVDQIARYAFDLARGRRKHLASITKSNASPFSYVLWDEVVAEVALEYPDVEVTSLLIDAAAAFFVTRPEMFDVVVASNLFGDILTDIGAVIQGSMGLAASANLNPDGGYPGMFEPVHGSAPDIAGKGIANPLGAVWAGALMLEDLGHPEAATRTMDALRAVLASGVVRTPDIGGQSGTSDVADALLDALRTRK
ncbi:MAG: tartrate dehydrogenase [Thermoleophilia bacterium]|nr:tartrate dehydrogenase [Thermoleophilia bacterium]